MAYESWRIPVLVQELAAQEQQPPARNVLPEPYHPVSAVADLNLLEPIPVIDLSRLLASDGCDDETTKLRLAQQSWGLFLVEGYGNDSVKFMDQTLDWSDRLHLKLEPADERNLARWPEHPESFGGFLHEYALNCKRIKDFILRAVARTLGLNEDYFIAQFSGKAPSFARFNYYPPCPRPDLVFGVKPHSDAGVLRILLMDKDVGELQVLRDGVWHNVPTSPHRLLINIGDYMEIMSNGIFKSPVHRVVTSAEKERISLVMFHGLDPEKEVEPATDLLHVEQPTRYRKVKAKEYIAGFYEHFSRGTRFLDTIKI